MVSPFGKQQWGNDLYSPAVSEWTWGGAWRKERGCYIALSLCGNGLLGHSQTHILGCACLSVLNPLGWMANFNQIFFWKWCKKGVKVCMFLLFWTTKVDMAQVTYIRPSNHPVLLIISWLVSKCRCTLFYCPAGHLDYSVSNTKDTEWNQGRAVMSDSSYSLTYRPSVVLGNLLKTMTGFERSPAPWNLPLIEFPGIAMQCWGWLWSGSWGLERGV